jgi:hypothetical protein
MARDKGTGSAEAEPRNCIDKEEEGPSQVWLKCRPANRAGLSSINAALSACVIFADLRPAVSLVWSASCGRLFAVP